MSAKEWINVYLSIYYLSMDQVCQTDNAVKGSTCWRRPARGRWTRPRRGPRPCCSWPSRCAGRQTARGACTWRKEEQEEGKGRDVGNSWLQASSLSRGLPTLWSHSASYNDAQCVIHLINEEKKSSKPTFLLFKNLPKPQSRTVHHSASYMMHCASLCDQNVGVHRGRLQSRK